jgi:hypothetical protein
MKLSVAQSRFGLMCVNTLGISIMAYEISTAFPASYDATSDKTQAVIAARYFGDLIAYLWNNFFRC